MESTELKAWCYVNVHGQPTAIVGPQVPDFADLGVQGLVSEHHNVIEATEGRIIILYGWRPSTRWFDFFSNHHLLEN